ncbi:hypothetical protein HELRODRAFT_158915 [Helobdella robusta]|uniref:Uncharacterized protein n=1 Tax=Helobdella robusta TaxID=6412 RepID=T1ENE3_HELRO|nr:hypothetical protein HELRODRAFT_158915 [Helobdella robusta]ESO12396.1 hypothetical protein HELRODRAFT_158915 [Helobdella robusta]
MEQYLVSVDGFSSIASRLFHVYFLFCWLLHQMLEVPIITLNACMCEPMIKNNGHRNHHFVPTRLLMLDVEIVDLLLNNGADISVRDENGLNAIMYALCDAEVDHSILNTLLNTDKVNKSFEALQKTVNTPAYDGATALYLAVQIASKEIMLLLLSVGADPDLVLRDEKLAPVHAAIALGHIELVEHLLPITLNSTLLRPESSPISLACDNGKSEMIKFLISHPKISLTETFPLPGYFCITPQSPYCTISYLTEAIMKDADLEIIKMLVQNGVPISCNNSSEIPPFYMAIYKNNVQVASYLLKIGASVNVYLNETMFNYSWVASDNLQVIKLILRHGAEYDSILNCNLSDMLNMHKDKFFKPRLKTVVSVICYLTNKLPHGSEECLELPLFQLLPKQSHIQLV